MRPNTAIQVHNKAFRKRRRTAVRWRKWIRRRQMLQQRDRRRKWLLALLLWALELQPAQMFFVPLDPAPGPAPVKRLPVKKSAKCSDLTAEDDPRTDYERLYISDCSTRYGEEHQEVMDGLTYHDIVALQRINRPWLFPKFKPIPGMPDRYKDEPVGIWTLLDHLQYDFLRSDAVKALKLLVDPGSHDWIDACAAGTQGNSWKDLRLYCKSRTPDATIQAFPRAAARWREEQRREAEERRKEAKETPTIENTFKF